MFLLIGRFVYVAVVVSGGTWCVREGASCVCVYLVENISAYSQKCLDYLEGLFSTECFY